MSGRPPGEAKRSDADVLRTVVENAPLVLWAIDRQGLFTLSEGRGLAHLGLKPGQSLGQSAFDMYKDFPDVIRNLRRALAGEEVLATLEVVGRAYETVIQPLRDASGAVTGVLGISTDVTERRAPSRRRGTCKGSFSRRRSSRAWACSRAASRTTSTTC